MTGRAKRNFCRIPNLTQSLIVAVFILITHLYSAALGMSFSSEGNRITASGEILQGDESKFTAFVASKFTHLDGFHEVTVRLNSPGGSLVSGIALGQEIRRLRFATLVAKDDMCASACALMFLGGTFTGITYDGIGRYLEYGGSLGFHGFRHVNDGKIALFNENLEVFRVITGIILSYAAEMKGVDLGWLSQAINTPVSELFLVRRPKDITAISAVLSGFHPRAPDGWYNQVCQRLVSSLLPSLDRDRNRLLPNAKTIMTIRELRNRIIQGKFGDDPISGLLSKIGDSRAIDIALGKNFYLDSRKPIFDIKVVSLDRGAGLYYSECVAVLSKNSVAAIITDPVSQRSVYRNFTGQNWWFSIIPEDTVLW